MSLSCALSGEAPQNPVINKVSGLVYEKNLLEKYIKENSKDPVTEAECTEDDIIEVNVKTFSRPRTSGTTSLPSLIKLLQDEYDAAALETFTLRKQLDSTRQELSHSLYQHDAACRVIARLTKERDEARSTLANVAAGQASAAAASIEEEPEEESGLPKDVVAKIDTSSEILQGERKEKKKPTDLATKDSISQYKETGSFTSMHSTSSPGVTCLAIHPKHKNLVATGGNDKKAVLYDTDKDSVVSTFKGHSKKVTCVQIQSSQELVITGSADSKVRVFGNDGDLKSTFDCHDHAITSVSLHPMEEFLASSDMGGKWGFHDIALEKTYQVMDDPNNSPITCGSIHPDGVLYGCGMADHMVRIWDIRSAKPAVAFEGHKGPVNGISFSGNGYVLASSGEDNVVRLWDLRKCNPYKTAEIEDPSFKLSCVQFDSTGTFFAAGGAKDVKVYVSRQAAEITTLSGHSKDVTAIQWHPLAQGLVTASRDRSVKVWNNN